MKGMEKLGKANIGSVTMALFRASKAESKRVIIQDKTPIVAGKAQKL